MIRDKVQQTLDTEFKGTPRVYWQRKSGPDTDEYIIFVQSGIIDEFHADDVPLLKTGNITVSYYYRAELLETYQGRQAVQSREDAIIAALEGAGFTIPYGSFDAGDVDGIGYLVSVFECEYGMVV